LTASWLVGESSGCHYLHQPEKLAVRYRSTRIDAYS